MRERGGGKNDFFIKKNRSSSFLEQDFALRTDGHGVEREEKMRELVQKEQTRRDKEWNQMLRTR